MTLNSALFDRFDETTETMPAFFIGHGSPMNAIESNNFTKKWGSITEGAVKPKAVLCISAHWETSGTKVCAVENPQTIHDFYGFPEELYKVNYPAPGSPEFASLTVDTVKKTHIEKDMEWGLDHGTWSVLCHMYPMADVPVFQMSIDYSKPPQWHFELAKELSGLRKKGVLIIGSGNIVHNLRLLRMNNNPFDWAEEFDLRIKNYLLNGDSMAIVNYEKLGTMANLAVPTNEHYIPLIYAVGVQSGNESVTFFNDELVMGSISMRSVKFG